MARADALLADQVATRPDKHAFSDSTGVRWSYGDLDRASDAVVDHLTRAGVRAQDRVLMLSENCTAAIAVLFACWKIDATVLPVNARMTEAEIDRIMTHATPAAVLFTHTVSPEATTHADRMDATEITGTFGAMRIATPLGSSPDPDLKDVGVLLYTTGTTGDPKGVMLTHDNMCFGGKGSAIIRQMVPGDVVYGALPITHVFGLVSVVVGTVLIGAALRLEARFSAAAMYAALRDDVTVLPAVPQMHALLMQYTREQGFDQLGSEQLRFASSGAAPLDPTWKRKAEAFYGVALQNGYGMTESSAGISATRNPIGTDDISVGPPFPDVEIRIDDHGDGTGEVMSRGGNIMRGYYRNPEETAKVLDADGWLRTGDLGRIDERGSLYILGRSKELIIHGGFNVYPPEVEAALNDHPQVIQAAVIGRAKAGDEEILAFVQVAQGDTLSAETLHAFVKPRLTGYKRPTQIVIGHALPAAPTGKILKHKLLDFFAGQID